MHPAASATAPEVDQLPAYWQFYEAVTRAQLTEWLPSGRHVLVDVSGPRAPAAELAARAGHTVVRVTAGAGDGQHPTGRAGRGRPHPSARQEPGDPASRGSTAREEPGNPASRESSAREEAGGAPPRGCIVPVIADASRLAFLADGCADGVIADDRALSVHLAAEQMAADIARVLRPGGRVLACVDSLVLGMAMLAAEHHWAELADLPRADVVLVPWPDGTITRCYGPDQARELFGGAGLTVDWIRSRTVFSESVVTHWLRRDPRSLPKLVRAELAARSGESLGAQLVISASKPVPAGPGPAGPGPAGPGPAGPGPPNAGAWPAWPGS